MNTSLASQIRSSHVRQELATHDYLIAHQIGDPSGLCFRFLTGGRIHSVLHGPDLLINLIYGCPLAGGMQRLFVELESDSERRVVTVIGQGSSASFRADSILASWLVDLGEVVIEAILKPDPARNRWTVEVVVENRGGRALRWRAFQGFDVGLAAPGAARNNEVYTSQYIDHRALDHPDFGKVVVSRQNLPVSGRHPFLLQACLGGCDEFATDARDVFGGPAERNGIEVPALREGGPALPGLRQGESSYVALRSRNQETGASSWGSCHFLAVFVPDHQAVSSAEDLGLVPNEKPIPGRVSLPDGDRATPVASVFDKPHVWHGQSLSEQAMHRYVPGTWDCIEKSPQGELWSFFTGGDSRHVVTRAKERVMGRPHATILRSGKADYPQANQLTTTCFAAGVFNSLLSSGHPSFHRLLSYPRESFGLIASSGQRVFVRDGTSGWRLLGVPSFFEMGLGHARWHYALPGRMLEITVTVDEAESSSHFELQVIEGGEVEVMVTHGLIAGVNEYDEKAELVIDPASVSARIRAAASNPWRQHDPSSAFVVRASDPDCVHRIGGAECLDGGMPCQAMLVIESKPTRHLSIEIAAESALSEMPESTDDDWREMAGKVSFKGRSDEIRRLNRVLPWLVHNGMIHFTVPHGVEQYNGGAWGTRDVTQGSVELLLALGRWENCRRVILETYRHQYEERHMWPQWFMLEPFADIQQSHSHGDIPLWPMKALCDYLEASSDYEVLDEELPWTCYETGRPTGRSSPLFDHLRANLEWLRKNCVPGTALLRYGDGDWNDSLQPARPELRKRLVSSWTVALCYQVLRRLEAVCQRGGRVIPGLDGFADEVKCDFRRLLIIDETVCGFFLFDEGSSTSGQPLLHPNDTLTGINYRLLPMTRSMIGGLFSADEAAHHEALIRGHLLAADGARLMDRPPAYRGGACEIFQRAESSPCFSREIGIMYTHAHLRYIEAMAALGRADSMLEGFGKVNPVCISTSVPHALPRQGNAYFSSSDAAVATRYEASDRYQEIVSGEVPVEGGWRIYSSGPGIIFSLLLTRMVGLRRHFDRVILDPVIPRKLDGLEVAMPWGKHSLRVVFRVIQGEHTPRSVVLNGRMLEPSGHSENPYRQGGWLIDAAVFEALIGDGENLLEIGI
ncbi:MAG: hypothetical protein ACO3SO_10315 [Luteolibacter sp.]